MKFSEPAQVSVVVFLLHGYVPSSRAALNQTLLISGAVSVLSTTLEGVFIWSLHIQLYAFSGEDHDRIQVRLEPSLLHAHQQNAAMYTSQEHRITAPETAFIQMCLIAFHVPGMKARNAS